ncbi:unnamed protein product [Withania somnifera]
MSETNSTTSMVPNGRNSVWQWKSPVPYLFVGLSLTLALITVALILLACSLSQRSSDGQQDKSARSANSTSTMVEMSPRIIVVMAGHRTPSHIGIPISSSDKCPD